MLLWNYDVILKGCALFFNWCIFVVIVRGFVYCQCFPYLIGFRNIFILMMSALSILPFWRHNVTYFKIQDLTKGMNVVRVGIPFLFYFLFHCAIHSLAYVCLFIFNLCKFYVTGDCYFLCVICLHMSGSHNITLFMVSLSYTKWLNAIMVVLRCFT